MLQRNNKGHMVLSASCFVMFAAMSSGLLTGCQAQKVAQSGFLGDYSKLSPSPDVEDALYYQDPAKSLKDYDKFMIDPVLVHFAPNAKGTALDPAKLKKLTDYAYDEATKALSERYTVVDAPGPGVLRLRTAITDIKKTKPAMNIHPATKLSGLGLGGASMEAEALDSQTGERVFAVVDTRQGNRLSIGAGLSQLGHAEQVIKHWIERFVERVDKAHGYDVK
jgi:hypothetical protein